MFSKLVYAMENNCKESYVSQLISIVDLQNLEWVLMFSKLAYAMIKKWEIKLCISVIIYHRLPKLGMSTHVFKISLAMIKNGK